MPLIDNYNAKMELREPPSPRNTGRKVRRNTRIAVSTCTFSTARYKNIETNQMNNN